MKHLKVLMLLATAGFLCFNYGVSVNATEKSNLNAGVTTFLAECLNTQAATVISGQVENSKSTGTSIDNTEATDTTEETEQTEKICGYTNLAITTVKNSLNIRKNPNEDSKIVGKLPKNGGCEVLNEKNGWLKIKSGKVTGWVSMDYMLTGDEAVAKAKKVAAKMATVTTETLFVREKAGTDSSVITMIAQGEELEVLKTSDNGWYKISIDNEKGWISGDYVTISNELPKAATINELDETTTGTSGGSSVVAYALQFVGNPYVWGGTSLTNGADCSGFTMSVYAHFGISLPHYSAGQSGYGVRVSASEAKPGDLFFYGSGSSISHVAIYMGGGQIVHASNEATGIKISNAFYRTPICVVRLINN